MRERNIYYIFILVFILVINFLIRSYLFNKPHDLTYDEYVYSVLAVQVNQNPLAYNTMRLYKEETSKGRLFFPSYFNKPLFKHPPLFTYLISVAYNIFGEGYYAGFFVSSLWIISHSDGVFTRRFII